MDIHGIIVIFVLIVFAGSTVAYPMYRNRLIATKGYDTDWLSIIPMLGVGATFAGLFWDNMVLAAVGFFAVPLVAAVFHMKKIGIGHAIAISYLQTFSILWRGLWWIIVMVWNICQGQVRTSNKFATDSGKARAKEKYEKAKREADAIYQRDPELSREMETGAKNEYDNTMHMLSLGEDKNEG